MEDLSKYLTQYLLKSLHIILNLRVPSIRAYGGFEEVKRSDKWFNMVLGDRPAVFENLNLLHGEPMIIDIILVQDKDCTSLKHSSGKAFAGAHTETIIERWVVQCENRRSTVPQMGDSSYKKMYKKSIILLRSVYSMLKLLPAFKAFRKLSSSSQSCYFDINFKVSSFSEPFSRAEEEMMKQFTFTSVDAQQGRLSLSVTYRENLVDFNLESSASFPPEIITDYVGSPLTDPLRSFPLTSTDKGVHNTSFPLRRTQSSCSAPVQRPQSWTSGLFRAPSLPQPYVGSPPLYHAPYELSTSVSNVYGQRISPNYKYSTHQKTTSFDDDQLSPPFSSSPSPPTYLSGANLVQTHLRSETDPVSIPHPLIGRTSRHLSPNSSLAYLEQIRQHMARLPSIDPNTRTILICGYPNVGKSSFINKITRADVDVQPYAFTTKSLFVGHTDYKYLRYQVIDTPGILDRPFEDRNIIEMCSITALAHLRAAVLFFLDISGSCGYSIAQQAALFHSIKSLFMNKPLMIVCNKTDLQPLEGISEEDKKLVAEMKDEAMKTVIGQGGEATDEAGVLLTMSTLTEDGVISVKNAACERLLNQRVELKMKSKKLNDCLNRFHVAMPKQRDQKERPACIPEAVLEARAKKADADAEKQKRKLERDLENENGGAGVYSASLRKHYLLANEEWKEDIMPEILDGHNVYDFVDPDILQRLEELEREEGLRQEEEGDDDFEMDGAELTPEEQAALAEIRKKKSLLIQQHRVKKSTAESRPTVPRKFDKDKVFTSKRMGRQLSALGLDPTLAINRARSKSRGRKRERSVERGDDNGNDAMDVDEITPSKKQRRSRSLSMARSRSMSRPRSEFVPGEGFKDKPQKEQAIKLFKKSANKRNKDARRGESDRVIPTLKPKHLFSGKRSSGKLTGGNHEDGILPSCRMTTEFWVTTRKENLCWNASSTQA